MKGDRHKHRFFRVVSNRKVAAKTWELALEGDTSDFTAPGQFVNIAVAGKYLRRRYRYATYPAAGSRCSMTLSEKAPR